MDCVRAMKEESPDARALELDDSTLAWYSYDHRDDEDDRDDLPAHSLRELIGQVVEYFAPAGVSMDDLPFTNDNDLSPGEITLRVETDHCTWTGSRSDLADGLRVSVSGVERSQLIRALLVSLEGDELLEAARRYVADAPFLVLRLLEGTLHWCGHGPVPAPAPPRDLLRSLLEHEDADVRQRAILLLGESRAVDDETKQSLLIQKRRK